MNLITKSPRRGFVVFGLLSLALGLSSVGLHAQQKHGDHSMKNHDSMHGSTHGSTEGAMQDSAHGAMSKENLPTQQGQSGFAAIAEIVEILNQDVSTDWSSINIAALREHLIDMSELTLRSQVKAEYGENEVQFFVTGEGRTLAAIQNMVPAHAKELTKMDGWSLEGTRVENGAILNIKADTTDIMTKIKGLGFYGLMATGAHHQQHHLAIAEGDMHVHE